MKLQLHYPHCPLEESEAQEVKRLTYSGPASHTARHSAPDLSLLSLRSIIDLPLKLLCRQ